MTIQAPLFASERNAAKLLDMKPAEFRALVEAESLPQPCKLIDPEGKDVERWDVEQLRDILRGNAAKPTEDFDL